MQSSFQLTNTLTQMFWIQILIVKAEYCPFWYLTLSTRCWQSLLVGLEVWIHLSIPDLVPQNLKLTFFLSPKDLYRCVWGFFLSVSVLFSLLILLNGEKKVVGFALLCVLNTDTDNASPLQSFPSHITCPQFFVWLIQCSVHLCSSSHCSLCLHAQGLCWMPSLRWGGLQRLGCVQRPVSDCLVLMLLQIHSLILLFGILHVASYSFRSHRMKWTEQILV